MNFRALMIRIVLAATIYTGFSATLFAKDAPNNLKPYRDRATKIVCALQPDRRHVIAYSPDGKVLWSRDVSAEVDYEGAPFRVPKAPAILSIGPTNERTLKIMKDRGKGSGHFAGVTFDSGTFGIIDLKNGDVTLMGQD